MTWQAMLAWGGPVLDGLVVLGLGVTLWLLRRDPSAAWQAYEVKLREMQESLRLLVLQAEGEARELDKRLAAHAEQMQALSESSSAAGGRMRASAGEERPPPPTPSLAERVQQLAAARTPIAEIARRLSLPIAEARVLAGLTTGGAAYASAVGASRPVPARSSAGNGGPAATRAAS